MTRGVRPACKHYLCLGAGLACMNAGVQAQDIVADAESAIPDDPPMLPGHSTGARTNAAAATPSVDPAQESETRREFLSGDWFGKRSILSERGIDIGASYTLDWSTVASGGVSRRASTRHLWDFNVTAHLEALLDLEGATLFADAYATNVNGGSADVGDFHGVSNIDSGEDVAQLAEVWFEQWLFDRHARLKLGQIDGNSEFAFLEHSASTLNASIAIPATAADLPTFPNPATGVVLFAYPTEHWYIGGGLFDGATADGFRTGNRGPDLFFSDERSDSWFVIAESGVTWESLGGDSGSGRFALGFHLHTAESPRFDGNGDERSLGIYALAEQCLLRAEPTDPECERGVYISALAGIADEDIREVQSQVGAGISYIGPFASRPDDRIAAFVSRLFTSPSAGLIEDETLFELQYVCAATRWCTITPDIQITTNPGGDGATDDAVTLGLRVEIVF